MASIPSASSARPVTVPRVVVRHSVVVRVCHWVNALCFLMLLMSGLQIFNARPGSELGRGDPVRAIRSSRSAARKDDNGDATGGVTTIFGRARWTRRACSARRSDPTARWRSADFRPGRPCRAEQDPGRRAALALLLRLVVRRQRPRLCCQSSRRPAIRDLVPTAGELRAIPRTIWDHVRLRFPRGEEALRYNVLQKLAYLSVDLRPSADPGAGRPRPCRPRLDAGFPRLCRPVRRPAVGADHPFHRRLSLSASCWCTSAWCLISGVSNNMRSMVTGRYASRTETPMSSGLGLDRRKLILRGCSAPPALLLLGGCARLAQSEQVKNVLARAEGLTTRRPAPRCAAAERWRANIPRPAYRPISRRNGSIDPDDRRVSAFARTASPTGGSRSAAWSSGRCKFSLADLRALPARTQITRHDCVEGWSCIGQWKGAVLAAAARRRRA